MLLRAMQRRLPNVPPAKRNTDPLCTQFKKATLLVIQCKYDEAVTLMDDALQIRVLP